MFQEFFTKLLANPITMIDLETLDVSPRAVVLSIGAIVFDFKRMQTAYVRSHAATRRSDGCGPYGQDEHSALVA